MKRFLYIFTIILCFLSFCVFDYVRHIGYVVDGVIDAGTFNIDLNKNGIIDDDEAVCVDGIEHFSSDIHVNQNQLAEKLNLTSEQIIGLGYLSENYAYKLLMGQKVRLKVKRQNTICTYADMHLGKINYAAKLYDMGFAAKDGKVNGAVFKDNLKKAEKLKLVVYNRKSAKFHQLECEYGYAARNSVVIPKKDLPEEAVPCKFCHIKKQKTKSAKSFSNILFSSAQISKGGLKLYLTDFTTQLHPNKTCTSEVCREFLNSVDNADKSIDIALYGWDNSEILNNAFKNAINRGVKVRLVYETTVGSRHFYEDTYNFAKFIVNSRSDEVAGNNTITNCLMHNKFMVVDNKKVLTGSMNFSSTGLSGFNANNFLVINSKEIAQLYTDEFEQMYIGKFHNLKTKSNKNNRFVINGSVLSIFFSPQDKPVTNVIVPLINNARNYIYMPVFLITSESVRDALIEAKNRGTDVKIIIDATTAKLPVSAAKSLRMNGIKVKTENYAGKMHSKSMIVDDKYIVLGSMNFSSSGNIKNDENMVLIEDPALAKFYKEFFLYLWAKIPDKYLKYNPRAEGKESIGSCSDGIDNNYDDKIDENDIGCMGG